jgi:hypothetical protein
MDPLLGAELLLGEPTVAGTIGGGESEVALVESMAQP